MWAHAAVAAEEGQNATPLLEAGHPLACALLEHTRDLEAEVAAWRAWAQTEQGPEAGPSPPGPPSSPACPGPSLLPSPSMCYTVKRKEGPAHDADAAVDDITPERAPFPAAAAAKIRRLL